MRLKHNKKRNTAFVYEALVRELTESVVKNNKNKQNKIVGIIKEHFKINSVLKRELELYRSIYETREMDTNIAEKVVTQVKKDHDSLDKKTLFQEQSALINRINRTLSNKVYNNFVPNYKTIASVYSIFQDTLPAKDRVLLEQNIIEQMSAIPGGEVIKTQEPIDNLTYSTFVKTFNKEYDKALNESQKALLGSYVSSFEDNGVDFKIFLNEEIGKLKEELLAVSATDEFLKDKVLKEKLETVYTILDKTKEKPIDTQTIELVLNAQQLVDDISKNES
tara:strand:- start:1588 stop:2421 length:834 start_codon:yes stop_codon:yes gene_type:complete